jgi:hypothetical protein
MRKDLTAICILVDGSGSMEAIKDGVVSGVNEFINSQKKVKGKALLSMHQFSSGYSAYPVYTTRHSHKINDNLNYRTIYNFQNIKEITEMTKSSYVPNGGTPLLDAMCKAIDDFGADLARIPEEDRPSKVVFVTITDGEENSSTLYNKENLLERIKHQSAKYDWNFIYLGASQDSFAEASKYGYSMKSTSNFQYSNAGMMRAMNAVSLSTTSYRSGDTNSVDLTDFQKEEQTKIDKVVTK